jgi:ADP-ribose pyrophosphatase YjhB (NUDIX family)
MHSGTSGLERFTPAVAVALVRREAESTKPEVLLVQLIDVRDGSAAPYVGAWVVPGGPVAEGESALGAAVSRVRRQTGLEVRAEELVELCELISVSDAGVRFLTRFFVADVAADAAPIPAPNEDIRWIDLQEANSPGKAEQLWIPPTTAKALRRLMDRSKS